MRRHHDWQGVLKTWRFSKLSESTQWANFSARGAHHPPVDALTLTSEDWQGCGFKVLGNSATPRRNLGIDFWYQSCGHETSGSPRGPSWSVLPALTLLDLRVPVPELAVFLVGPFPGSQAQPSRAPTASAFLPRWPSAHQLAGFLLSVPFVPGHAGCDYRTVIPPLCIATSLPISTASSPSLCSSPKPLMVCPVFEPASGPQPCTNRALIRNTEPHCVFPCKRVNLHNQ